MLIAFLLYEKRNQFFMKLETVYTLEWDMNLYGITPSVIPIKGKTYQIT